MYTHISAGMFSTGLVRSDGTAYICEFSTAIDYGEGEIMEQPPAPEVHPDIPCGVKYTQISCGRDHTVLLCSDGKAIGIGDNSDGQINIPELEEGVTYIQIATGDYHTMLLRSDGTAVAFGENRDGQLDLPTMEHGVIFIPSSVEPSWSFVVQVHMTKVLLVDKVEITCTNLVSGDPLATWTLHFIDWNCGVHRSVQRMLMTSTTCGMPCQRLLVVEPNGRLVGPNLVWDELLPRTTRQLALRVAQQIKDAEEGVSEVLKAMVL